MGLLDIDHVNIDTPDLAATVAFYRDVLGLEERPKPSGNPGAWMYCDDRAVVHLNVVPAPAGPVGPLNHVAFAADGFEAMQQRLAVSGVDHRVSDRPDMGLVQIFLEDPNGIPIELSFTRG